LIGIHEAAVSNFRIVLGLGREHENCTGFDLPYATRPAVSAYLFYRLGGGMRRRVCIGFAQLVP